MLQKNFEVKSHKAESHDVKKIQSSQHSKNKKNMADQLRREIELLIEKQHKAKKERWNCLEEYNKLKAKGEVKDADFQYMSYRMWSDEAQRLGEEIHVKLKAVQKYESFKKMEELKDKDKKEQYMKYGPNKILKVSLKYEFHLKENNLVGCFTVKFRH